MNPLRWPSERIFLCYNISMPDSPFSQKKDAISPLRTMREDVAALSQRGQSPAEMIARPRPGPVLLGEKEQFAREFASARRWRLALMGGIGVAIFIGIGLLGFFLLYPSPTPSEEEGPALFLPFSAVRQEELSFRLGDREGLIALFGQAKQRAAAAPQPIFLSPRLFSLDIARKESRQAVPTGSPRLSFGEAGRQASVFEVFQTLRLRPPAPLLQAFVQEIYPYILADAIVFVIPVKNTQKALEGFLAWEPLMERDFAPFLPPDTQSAPFRDRIIGNVDTRVSSALSYALFGGRYAVIALSERTLEEAINHLAKK